MKIINLTKTYKTKSSPPVKAIDGINIELPDSGLIFILGKSGCGKTTLLNVLGGLDKADSGEIIVDGKDVCSATESELRSYRNEYCGFIFQEFNLINELNVSENITLALDIKRKESDSLEQIIEQVELTGLEKRRVNELSGGQKQRVAIARSLIKKPKIILADEPTGALDSNTGENILNLLKKISTDRLVIVVSHDREFAKKYADRIIELSDGKIISDTDKNYIDGNSGEFTVSKADLPLKTAFKIGINSIKLHPVKFIMMILISVLSFSFLGTSLTGVFTKSTDFFLNGLKDTHGTAIRKYEIDDNSSGLTGDEILGANLNNYNPLPLTQEDIAELKKYTSLPIVGSLSCVVATFQRNFTNLQHGIVYPNDGHYALAAYGYLCATQDDLNALGFKVTGRLPQNAEEIAIPYCLYKSFEFLGLTEDANNYEIKTRQDILGRKIPIHSGDIKTIVGVVDSVCYIDVNANFDHSSGSTFEYEFCEKIFVHKDFLSEYDSVIIPTYGNKADLRRIVNYVFSSVDGDPCYKFINGISSDYYRSVNLNKMMQNLFAYIGIAFVVLSVLLLVNFVAISIQSQIKQIGILSALGVGTGGILKIYLSFMAIFGVIVFGLAYGLSFVWNHVVNLFLTYQSINMMFLVNALAPLCLLLVVAATITVGTVIPVLLIKRKSPAEIIRKGCLQ